MRIIDKANSSVEFRTIKTGDCFIYDNCLLIKMYPIGAIACNAFCFVDNTIVHVRDDQTVIPVEAEIVIHNKGAE